MSNHATSTEVMTYFVKYSFRILTKFGELNLSCSEAILKFLKLSKSYALALCTNIIKYFSFHQTFMPKTACDCGNSVLIFEFSLCVTQRKIPPPLPHCHPNATINLAHDWLGIHIDPYLRQKICQGPVGLPVTLSESY